MTDCDIDNPAALLDAMQAQGYVVLRGALPPALVRSLADFVYARYAQHAAGLRGATGFALEDPAARAALVADRAAFGRLPSELQHLVRGELPLCDRLDPRLRAVAHEPAVSTALRTLLVADELRMHNPPSIRVSVPSVATGNVPMHQDFAYNPHMQDFITAWVPLCVIDDACGGVDVYAGSHRSQPLPHEPEVVWSHRLKDEAVAASFARLHVLVSPGDVLLFGPYLLHASHPNTSERVRCSIDYRFFSSNTKSAKHYYDVTRRKVVAPTDRQGA